MTLHILHTPMQEIRRRPDGEPRFCFRCRKHRQFVLVVTAPIVTSIEDTGAYYAPTPRIECSVCKLRDGDMFPGTEREWGDA